MRPKLRSVDTPAELPVDIGALMRLDRDDPERRRRVHVESWRRNPIDLPSRWRVWRLWR